MCSIYRRGTLLIPSGPAGDGGRKHLFVYLTDPFGVPEQVLLVPVCSCDGIDPLDDSCLLDVGHHPFVNHPSYIDYAHSRIQGINQIVNGIKNMFFYEKEPMPKELYILIVAGLRQSRFVKPHIKEFFDEFENSIGGNAYEFPD